MKNMYALFILMLLICGSAFAQSDSFVVDGVYRNYILYLPAGYNASSHYPLVLSLHGYTSNASQEELYTQGDVSADANNYIIAYPNGIANYWNSWGPPGTIYGADDVKFLTALIDTISARYSVNPKRVYSCGISNGGYMTYTLACSLADRLAAIASVSGTMSNYTYANCNVTRKIPVLHVHGTTDHTVPYATGAANSIGAEQTVAFWRDTDACARISDTTYLPDINTGDSSTVQLIRYQNCPASNEVLFYKIINGGHTWPGGIINIPSYGNTNRDISATDEIWKFFSRYTLDGPATGISEMSAYGALHISPNPASDQLTIQTEDELLSTDIYDLSGRKIKSAGNAKSIDIQYLSPGIYIAEISCRGDRRYSLKFIKQ
jgi:polyhydroxybutyrate depolymerase